MKALLTLCLIQCLIASVATAGVTFTTGVTFGRKSSHCNGLGLCNVDTKQEGGAIDGFLATWDYDAAQNTLSMSIRVAGNAVPGQLLSTRFVQEEDLVLPEELSRQLGAPAALTIHRGSYSIRREGAAYLVIFQP